jgi:hypothetical protein
VLGGVGQIAAAAGEPGQELDGHGGGLLGVQERTGRDRPVLGLPAQPRQQVPAGEAFDQLSLLRVVELGQLSGQPAFKGRQVRVSGRQAAVSDK